MITYICKPEQNTILQFESRPNPLAYSPKKSQAIMGLPMSLKTR